MNGITATNTTRIKSKMRDLVIVLIIVALTATFTVIGSRFVIIRDKRSPTVIVVTQIEASILAYYTEYSEMPDASNNARLMKILSGDNPRNIEFIKLKPAQFSSVGQVLDEWGTPLRISVDVHTKIIVTSAGPDKIFGTADDITNH